MRGDMMHEYRTARSVFGFVEFLAWAMVIGGVFVVIAGFTAGSAVGGFGRTGGFLAVMMATLPGIGMIAISLTIIVFVQIGRAGVDTSERVGRLIEINRDGFQYLKSQSSELPASFDLKSKPISANVSPAPETLAPQTIPYKGYEIVVGDSGSIRVGKQDFMGIDIAKRYIDEMKPLNQQGLQPVAPEPEKAPVEAKPATLSAKALRPSERTEPTLSRPAS